MKKTFTYEYEEASPGSLSYEISLEENERLVTLVEDGKPILYMNRPAMLTLAKLLIKLAEGPYEEQFHLHLRRDFGDGPDALTVMLYPDDVPVRAPYGS
jgi:hypothetical protein